MSGRIRFARVLVDHQRVGRQKLAFAQQTEELDRYWICVRRIEVDDVERAFEAIERAFGGSLKDRDDAADAEILRGVFDRVRDLALRLDRDDACRAARGRLEADRAGAGEKVEDASAIDTVHQDRKERFFDSPGRRANVRALRRLQLTAPKRTPGDLRRHRF